MGVFACNPRLVGILRLSYSFTVIDTAGSGFTAPMLEGANENGVFTTA
jgi:hypothetical protein